MLGTFSNIYQKTEWEWKLRKLQKENEKEKEKVSTLNIFAAFSANRKIRTLYSIINASHAYSFRAEGAGLTFMERK